MKRTVLLAGLLSMFCGGVAEAVYVGPIDVENKPFQFSLGANASYIAMDREADGREVKSTQKVFVGEAEISVKGWELGLAAGVADWEYNQLSAGFDADGGLLPYARIDAGGPLFRGKDLTIGPFMQVSYSEGFTATSGTEKMEVGETLDIAAGLLFQVTLEGAQLYGGPVFYQSFADLTTTSGGNQDLETRKLIGGIAGVSWPLYTGFRLDLEGQWIDGAGISGSLSYPF